MLGRGQLALTKQEGLRPRETQAGSAAPAAGRPWPGVRRCPPPPAAPGLPPPPSSPARQPGERGLRVMGTSDVGGRQPPESGRVYGPRNGGSGCQARFTVGRGSEGSAKPRREGVAGGGTGSGRAWRSCQAQPPPPAGPGGPSPAPPALRQRGTYVKTKNKVVEPTNKAAAVETGMYFVGLNLFPVLLGIL